MLSLIYNGVKLREESISSTWGAIAESVRRRELPISARGGKEKAIGSSNKPFPRHYAFPKRDHHAALLSPERAIEAGLNTRVLSNSLAFSHPSRVREHTSESQRTWLAKASQRHPRGRRRGRGRRPHPLLLTWCGSAWRLRDERRGRRPRDTRLRLRIPRICSFLSAVTPRKLLWLR